jgi:hypothetical protein
MRRRGGVEEVRVSSYLHTTVVKNQLVMATNKLKELPKHDRI